MTSVERPQVASSWRARLERLSRQTAKAPPRELAAIVRDELALDLTARYAGLTIPHPFGKASGQLSCTAGQVEADVEAGIAFIVLKTVIAEDREGSSTMAAWAAPETRMRVERRAARDGRPGWTVTWKGRGWSGSLDQYLAFVAAALDAAREADVPIIPSVKYHLPAPGEPFAAGEYRHTTGALLELWDRAGCGGPMILEKDFSPTLAGDPRAGDRRQVLQWLRRVPGLISGEKPDRIRLGVKVMNALFDDAFQVEMVRAAAAADPPPAFLVVFNRLFDAERGVAYGGWDLSDRNLRVLDQLRRDSSTERLPLPPLSATGNIISGKIMLDYARRGCESGQLHTFFQLPLSEYSAKGGSRTARALHTLLLHPYHGLCVWLRHLRDVGEIEERDGAAHFLDAVGRPGPGS